MLRPLSLSVSLALAAACASPRDDVAQPGVIPAPASAPAPTQGPPPAPPEASGAPLPGRDHRSTVTCSSDVDCGWDDPCAPTRCVEPRPPAACDESTPPPGTCACVAGSCTLKPHTPPPPTGRCEPRACMVDRAGGRCVADDGGVAEGLRVNRPVDVGPSCDCIQPDQGCTFAWFEPVPCISDRDCWVSHSPRRHPIPRPKELRRRDFEPCKDGEVAPRCGPAGQCIVGPAYGC